MRRTRVGVLLAIGFALPAVAGQSDRSTTFFEPDHAPREAFRGLAGVWIVVEEPVRSDPSQGFDRKSITAHFTQSLQTHGIQVFPEPAARGREREIPCLVLSADTATLEHSPEVAFAIHMRLHYFGYDRKKRRSGSPSWDGVIGGLAARNLLGGEVRSQVSRMVQRLAADLRQ